MVESKSPLILTIDDEKNIRKSFRNFLEDYEYRVIEAENGQIGLELFKTEKPNLVLVDLRMPEIDGLEVLKEITNISPNTPIIVVSGTGIIGDAVEALRLGAWDYLLKPIEDISVLLHAVEKALERANLIRENKDYQEHLELEIKKRTQELEESNAALAESENTLNSIIGQIPDIIYRLDPEGKIVFISQSVSRYGYSPESLIGQSIFDFVHHEDKEIIKQHLNERRKEKRSTKSLEVRLKTPNRKADSIESHGIGEDNNFIFSVDAEGIYSTQNNGESNFLGTQGIARDITERKKLEEQLQHSQKMEAIGMLAGGIAHDFNNLLTSIMGYSYLSLNQLKEDNPLFGNIKEIQSAGERATSLTRQLLAFSRKQVIQPQIIDLNKLINNTQKMLKRIVGENIEFITIPDSSIGYLKADPGQIEQIVMNLVVNARDAMPNGGKLIIETSNTYLDDAYSKEHIDVTPGQYIMLSISDNGCGIDKETLKHIFEPFFTTKEMGKGTGLGLSTVYGIIKQSGGHIFVYSEIDKGTAFKVYFPRIYFEEEKQPSDIGSDKHLYGNETILVVEDDETVRKLIATILTSYGYKIHIANSGDAALHYINNPKGKIDLLLTDVILPKMSGTELADKVTSICKDIKIVFMSGYTDRSIVQHGILEEGINYIQKPFTHDILVQKIRKVLDAKRKSS